MVLKNFTTFLNNYGKTKKNKLLCFFLLSLVAGFLEFVGIALIYPFIMLLISPNEASIEVLIPLSVNVDANNLLPLLTD